MALNKTGLARLWQHIVARLGTKVDKVEGKGLSTNDFARDGALVLTLADGQEFVYRPPAALTFHVVDEMLQITYEEEVAPT